MPHRKLTKVTRPHTASTPRSTSPTRPPQRQRPSSAIFSTHSPLIPLSESPPPPPKPQYSRFGGRGAHKINLDEQPFTFSRLRNRSISGIPPKSTPPPPLIPYPRAYSRQIIDLEVWETAWIQQLSSSLSYHLFPIPPSNV
jgi:hypothetical protein